MMSEHVAFGPGGLWVVFGDYAAASSPRSYLLSEDSMREERGHWTIFGPALEREDCSTAFRCSIRLPGRLPATRDPDRCPCDTCLRTCSCVVKLARQPSSHRPEDEATRAFLGPTSAASCARWISSSTSLSKGLIMCSGSLATLSASGISRDPPRCRRSQTARQSYASAATNRPLFFPWERHPLVSWC